MKTNPYKTINHSNSTTFCNTYAIGLKKKVSTYHNKLRLMFDFVHLCLHLYLDIYQTPKMKITETHVISSV